MCKDIWKLFWVQVGSKKEVLKLDNSTFFHYVVLEFLGYAPNTKISEDEKRMIRCIEKNTPEYDKLLDLYNERFKDYTLS